jgi:hypothetical protein
MQSKLIFDIEPLAEAVLLSSISLPVITAVLTFLTCYDFSYRQSKSTHGNQDTVSLGEHLPTSSPSLTA